LLALKSYEEEIKRGRNFRIWPFKWSELENHIGVIYEMGRGVTRDYTEAVKWYRKGVDRHDRYATINLARHYVLGKGIEQDNAKAIKFFVKFFVGLFGENLGVDLDVVYKKEQRFIRENTEAFKQLLKDAGQGNVKAQASLGVMYAKGLGVERDDEKALEWFLQAASHYELEEWWW